MAARERLKYTRDRSNFGLKVPETFNKYCTEGITYVNVCVFVLAICAPDERT